MNRLLTGKEMKDCDTFTINALGVPSEVLMGRAAKALADVASAAAERLKPDSPQRAVILAVCGIGNNGGDGFAAARILKELNFDVRVTLIGDSLKMSENCVRERKKASDKGVAFDSKPDFEHADIIIDAIFGIGLARDVGGVFADAINKINNSLKYVIAADIPSGICADTGRVLGKAVKANETVTFAYAKRGLAFYPGRTYAGKVTVADIGIKADITDGIKSDVSSSEAYEKITSDIKVFTALSKPPFALPVRAPSSNKGSYGKVLVIGGAVNMAGAAYLSAKAAYRTGTGLVNIFTSEENRIILQTLLPEAVLITYKKAEVNKINISNNSFMDIKSALSKAVESSDTVIVGPGLSQSETAKEILITVLKTVACPLVIDADALNILAANPELWTLVPPGTVVTPHMGEMSRLTGESISALKSAPITFASEYAKKRYAVCVLKDAVTTVSDGNDVYLNHTGNSGMSKGGAGDVLTGVIGGLLAQGLPPFKAACTGVYLHGLAGDFAVKEFTEYSLLARDIADALPAAIMNSTKLL